MRVGGDSAQQTTVIGDMGMRSVFLIVGLSDGFSAEDLTAAASQKYCRKRASN